MGLRLLFLSLGNLPFTLAFAQFSAIITSVPDSAKVLVNGQEVGHTPIDHRFYWRQAVNGRMVIEVAAPGYKSWSDTLDHKPKRLDMSYSVHLDRDLPKFEVELAASPIIAFDKLLADIPVGTVIARSVDKDGKVVATEWDGPARFGAASIARRFEEVLLFAGFRLPGSRKAKLFDGSDGRPLLPKYVVGAKVLDYRVEQWYSEQKHYGDGPYIGTTRLRIEWHVLDKSTDKTVLTEVTEGLARQRQWQQGASGENLVAFESALVAFLKTGKLQRLLKEAPVVSPEPSSSVPDTALPETVIPRVQPVAAANLSELIGSAEHSCVTVLTDGGHGSGVIVSTEGHVLSAYHVVQGVNRIDVLFSDGLKQEAKVVSFDVANDVVLLDISGSGFKPLPIGHADKLKLGVELITIGTPAEVVLGQSIAKGILSGRRSFAEGVFLQTDMSVSPGNSGGPLIDPSGTIVGIVQRKVIGDAVEGIGLAIPIEKALEVLRLRVADQ